MKVSKYSRDYSTIRTPELNTFPSNFRQELMLEGILASIGSVGDAYDNALAESTIGLFKTEAISKGNPFHAGPFKNIDDIEYATMGWVDWYNNRRLHSSLDYVPPVESGDVPCGGGFSGLAGASLTL